DARPRARDEIAGTGSRAADRAAGRKDDAPVAVWRGDAHLARHVGADVIALDQVAFTAVDPVRVAGNDIASRGGGSAGGWGRGGADAGGWVAQGHGPRDIGADEVALDHVGVTSVDPKKRVPGDQVPRAGDGPADGTVGHAEDALVVRNRLRSG